MILGGRARRVVTRAVAVGAAVIFAAVPFITGSIAAAVSSVLVLAVGSLVIVGWWRPWMMVALVTGLLAVLLSTMLLGATYSPERTGSASFVEERLSETRVGALARRHRPHDPPPAHRGGHRQVLRREPGRRGRSRYPPCPPGIPRDRRGDGRRRWSPARVPGRCGRRSAQGSAAGSAATIAAVGVIVLGIHACIDYVLHFPIVPITAAALAGAAAAEGRSARTTEYRRNPSPME